MQNVDYVIHAAALKQVPIAEYNPFEGKNQYNWRAKCYRRSYFYES